jgi:hypothetical protein
MLPLANTATDWIAALAECVLAVTAVWVLIADRHIKKIVKWKVQYLTL